MAASYAQRSILICPQCKENFEAEYWLIIDTNERPELVERVRDNTLHAVTCPHCNTRAILNLPLLIYHPGAQLPVLFSPSPSASPEQHQGHLDELIRLLHEQLGAELQEEWLAQGVPGLSREELPAFLSRYLASGNSDDLDQAIEMLQRGLHLIPPTSPERVRVLSKLGPALRDRYNVAGALTDLRQAIECFEQAVQLIPQNSPDLAGRLSNLSLGLLDLYASTGDLTDLERAIECSEQAVRLTPLPSPGRAIFLNNLSLGLRDYYERTGDVVALDRAIECCEQAVQLHPPNSPMRAAPLNNLGLGLNIRYVRNGNLATLEQAIECFEQAVHLTAPTSPDLAGFLHNLGLGLSNRYEHTGELADLEQALRRYQQALQLTPPASPDQVMFLSNLGLGWRQHYGRTGDPGDINRAVEYLKQALQLIPPSSPNMVTCSNNLGLGLYDRYASVGGLADLEQAIECFQRAVRLTLPASPSRAIFLNSLGGGLRDRYTRAGDLADLEQAIECFEQAIRVTPPASPDQVMYLNNLGLSLGDRYNRTSGLADLERALECYQQALRLTPPTSPVRAMFLSNLGIGLRDRYARTGDLSDIEQAVEYSNQALQLTPLSSPERAGFLQSLGLGLHIRYAHSGDLIDLEQSIECYQQALRLTPATSPARAMFLSNLSVGLRDRYARTGDQPTLERAIECSEQAVQLTRPGSPDLAARLNNLGISLYDRYARAGELADLEQVIKYFQQALRLTPPMSLERAGFLGGLGLGLRDRYARKDDLADLEQAIECFQQTLQLIPSGSPNHAKFLHSLGLGLRDRHARTGDVRDLEKGVDVFRQSCEHGLNSSIKTTLLSSRIWGNWALGRAAWEEAAQAFRYGLQAIDWLFRTQLLRASKAAWLREAQTLSGCAAYAFARTGDLASAVQTLEGGRARLLADSLERDHADLKHLREMGYAELYERYRMTVEEIARLEKAELRQESLTTDFDTATSSRSARFKLDAAIKEIQQVAGYEGFFRAPDFESVRHTFTTQLNEGAQSVGGVYLVVTLAGGVALVVHSNGVEAVWLDFKESDLHDLLVKRRGETLVGGYLAGQLGLVSLEGVLDEVLPVTGEKIIEPVAAALRDTLPIPRGSGERPTLILIPTGLLSLLPLHAAVYQREFEQCILLDEFTVACAPSARTLAYSRESLSSLPGTAPSFFGISNPLPLPAGMASLAFARTEVEEITQLFGTRAETLYEIQATRSAVEAGLNTATHLHFSCHGQFDSHTPLASGLMLSNGEQLTLSDLLNRSALDVTRLVILSACQTAITDFNQLPEEVVGLPSGFLQAGAPGVIGSLWSVNDLSTALLMIKFYKCHLQGDETARARPMPPAQALRFAQLWLRDVTNAELSELFKTFKQTAPDASEQLRMSYAVAREGFRRYTLNDPHERPFAHPYYWAAFTFYGA